MPSMNAHFSTTAIGDIAHAILVKKYQITKIIIIPSNNHSPLIAIKKDTDVVPFLFATFKNHVTSIYPKLAPLGVIDLTALVNELKSKMSKKLCRLINETIWLWQITKKATSLRSLGSDMTISHDKVIAETPVAEEAIDAILRALFATDLFTCRDGGVLAIAAREVAKKLHAELFEAVCAQFNETWNGPNGEIILSKNDYRILRTLFINNIDMQQLSPQEQERLLKVVYEKDEQAVIKRAQELSFVSEWLKQLVN